MELTPSYSDYVARADAPQAMWTTLVADLDTPVSLFLKLAEARKDSFLLESVTGGEMRGRYSIIGFKPDLIWRCRGDTAEINRSARWNPDGFEKQDAKPLDALRALIAESAIETPPELPPAACGLFGYFGYDMVRHVERLPDQAPDPLDIYDAVLMRPTVVAVVDAVKNVVTLVAPLRRSGGSDPGVTYARAAEQLSDALGLLDRAIPADRAAEATQSDRAEIRSNMTEEAYRDAVRRAQDYIRAGDIFQAVPSQRYSRDFGLPPFALYRALRRTNPSPYMFFFNFGDMQIVGASPETLVKVQDRKVTIRPIAGTRPRGETPEQDRALEAELLADPKERAEHLMLLDLGRNDVGRVAKIGSVDPNAQFTVERYSHVMHIVSNVDGALRHEEDALSALLAGLPAGTVSGAPKIRAMEIIDELEPHARGVYAGGVGYFAAQGDMDFCIALRTAVLKDGAMHVQAGGGVVYDSDPEAERMETVHKARAVMRAAEEAGRFAWRGGNR